MLQDVTSQREAEMALGDYGSQSSPSNQQSLVLTEDDHQNSSSLSSSKKSKAKSNRVHNTRFEMEE